ncbi:MAG: Hsp20/alpha crystallin family protein [Verrucomicrobia bacterium]|nr:Hsp20/alpha crystallin family protein [Verrucomicrobiota bacterium]
MEKIRQIKLRVQGTEVRVSSFQLWRGEPHRWQPAINAFRCATAVRICVDLAGVDQRAIELTVESRRVILRGSRSAPEPTDQAVQMLALEIDYGPFEREVHLPREVEVNEARAEQDNGLLWIYLPLKK